MTIYENALQVSAVRGDATDLKLKVVFDVPASDYKVYVNGFATTEYEVVNGTLIKIWKLLTFKFLLSEDI